MADARPLVVVVGSGFGGLTLARELAGAPVRVLVIDRNNYHLFTPLLYQVATAMLDPSEIAQPVRKLLGPQSNADFLQAEVQDLDLDARQVVTDRGRLRYDYVVLAAGSETNYFGNRSLEGRAFGLKELPEGLALRNRILERFEEAQWEGSPERRRRLLSFAVIGGGPTGIEFAGALRELIHLMVRRDYPRMDPTEPHVVLLEGMDRLLSTFHPDLSEAARRALVRKGVEVHLEALVDEVQPGSIRLHDGRTMDAGTVVWTAGVRAGELGAQLGVELARQGRVPVTDTLQLAGRPEVFAIGDAAARDELPMLIPVAMQQARHVARAIRALESDRPVPAFQFHDPGIMATIGRSAAVAQLGRVRLSGFPGWVLWLTVHLANVVTFRARMVVLLNWAWEYVFYDRPIRLRLQAGSGPRELAAVEE